METTRQVVDLEMTPEYFSKNKIDPQYLKIPLLIFEKYEEICKIIPDKMESVYKSIDPKYLTYLPFKYEDKIEKVRQGIKVNQAYFNKVASLYHDKFANVAVNDESFKSYVESERKFLQTVFFYMLIRDWADEGKEERDISYGEVLKELKKYFNYEDKTLMDKGVKVFLPCARLGRMGYELAKCGYNVEMTETCYFYLMLLDQIFNKSGKYENEIAPRIHSFCSSFSEESVIKRHKFPDVDIRADLANIKPNSLTLNKGKLTSYKDKKDLFDSVITVFNTDEIPNIVEFIEIIHDILKKGGVWINFGGLSNVYVDYGGFELTWDELKQVILNYDFEIKREETPVVPYFKIEGNSLPHTCGVVFFTAVKK